MTFLFDEEGDVLGITIGQPRKAVAEELKNNIAIKGDPKSGEIVGVVMNFLKRFKTKKEPEKIDLPLNIFITTN
jgi:hypothetical protein